MRTTPFFSVKPSNTTGLDDGRIMSEVESSMEFSLTQFDYNHLHYPFCWTYLHHDPADFFIDM